jgi:hypothetical protein
MVKQLLKIQQNIGVIKYYGNLNMLLKLIIKY